MKKILLAFFMIGLCAAGYAQNNVGIGTNTPDPSAVLDLNPPSQSLGFLVPRTHIALVSTPTARGLVIYDLDSNCLVLYNGATWQNLCAPPSGPPQTLAYNDNIYINANGTITIVDSNGNHILTTPQSAWTTLGNSGTTAGTNFAGTTDAQDFVLKSNNNEVIRATQTGAVGIQTPVPDPTSILDITSTTKGVLIPSMTSVQRDAIIGPAIGLMIYDTDLNVHQFWNGTCWVNVGQTVCSFVYTTSFVNPSHTADCLLVSNFSSVSDTISVSLISGTASPVILSAVGVPAGVLVNFSNNYILPTGAGVQSIMTFTALPSAVSGTYTVTVLASSGSTVQTLTYTLTVFGFGLNLNPTSATVSTGGLSSGSTIATTTVSIGNASTCSSSGGTAILSATVSGTGSSTIGVSFGTVNLAIPGSTTMTLTSNCPLAGTYIVNVTALIGSITSTATYTLTLTPGTPYHISVSGNNVNLFTYAGSPTCQVVDTFYVDAGVTVGSTLTPASYTTPPNPAMTTGNFASGSVITIINNGNIIGCGGYGGDDNNHSGSTCPTADGYPGGDAIDVGSSSITLKIINNGTIGGGGGGGGAGSELSGASACFAFYTGGSGGGGAGSAAGQGSTYSSCNAGSNGTLLTGGAGGAQCNCSTFGIGANSGAGGNGGNLGQVGGNGAGVGGLGTSTSVCGAGTGGAAGYAINGNGCSCYTATGAAVVGPTHP